MNLFIEIVVFSVWFCGHTAIKLSVFFFFEYFVCLLMLSAVGMYVGWRVLVVWRIVPYIWLMTRRLIRRHYYDDDFPLRV